MLKTTIGLLLAAAVASAADSPLVALAKKTNRQGSKTPVITEESLARTSGKISVAGGDTATAPAAETASAPATAAPAAKAAETKKAAAAPAVRQEVPRPDHWVSQPTSTVQTTRADSTLRTATPSSTVGTTAPTSGAGTIEPQSTARNIPPQTVEPPRN